MEKSDLLCEAVSYKMFYNNSLVVDENLSPDNPLFWSRPTPINCNTVRIIGIFLCLAGFIGIILNGALSYSFIRYKFLRTPPNIFIMFISSIGLLASCTIIPLAECMWSSIDFHADYKYVVYFVFRLSFDNENYNKQHYS
ncbi:unnamed protein product [Rotaria sordida]|uniref:Uncharacterized protein n=1 Tax=Rotaria sordida TaxID=392033 RepID=A0A813T440_9BILA|nr:unnamed protein product [Rotaria sordida]CAF1180846.1 unnamed protein product [Rotaria sordida]CAF1189992.1 unnamed protein product [Rotaria sordida]